MFKSLKALLLSVSGTLANTNYLRIILIASIVIPLVLVLYDYLDEVLLNANTALQSIEQAQISSSGKTFPVGSYAISYLNVAQLPTCLTTIFGYLTSAIVWSFTYDLKPMFTRK